MTSDVSEPLRKLTRKDHWNLRLQGYHYEAKHTKGKENPSDYLSRYTSLVCDDKQGTIIAEEYVNLLMSSAVPKAMTLQEIQQATTKLQCLIYLTQNQQWHSLNKLPQQFKDADIKDLQMFKPVKDELTVNEQANIILHGSHIMIPNTLQNRAILIAHEGHQGLVKTKQLLREKVWFPGNDDSVKQKIDKCIAFQANSSKSSSDVSIAARALAHHSHGFLWSVSYR